VAGVATLTAAFRVPSANHSLTAPRIEFGPDGSQFRARLVGDAVRPAGAAILP
jgi:hypothetical protein